MYCFDRAFWEMYSLARKFGGNEYAKKFRQYAIKNLKEKHRYVGHNNEQLNFDCIYANSTGDYIISKSFLPRKVSDDEWEEIEEECSIKYYYGDHDCTGKMFTQTMLRFEVPKGTWIYRMDALDV